MDHRQPSRPIVLCSGNVYACALSLLGFVALLSGAVYLYKTRDTTDDDDDGRYVGWWRIFWHLLVSSIFPAMIVAPAVEWMFSYHVQGQVVVMTDSSTTNNSNYSPYSDTTFAEYTAREDGRLYRCSWSEQYGPSATTPGEEEEIRTGDAVSLLVLRGFPRSARPCTQVLVGNGSCGGGWWCPYWNPFCKNQQLCWIITCLILFCFYAQLYFWSSPDRLSYAMATLAYLVLVWPERKYAAVEVMGDTNIATAPMSTSAAVDSNHITCSEVEYGRL